MYCVKSKPITVQYYIALQYNTIQYNTQYNTIQYYLANAKVHLVGYLG